MVRKIEGIVEESVTLQECHHHWIIKMAAGPISGGVCSICGAEKEFKNYPSDHLKMEDEFRKWIGRLGADKSENNSNKDVLSLAGREQPDATIVNN